MDEARPDYSFVEQGGAITVTDARAGGDGTDLIDGIEFVTFANGTYSLAAVIERIVTGDDQLFVTLHRQTVVDAAVLTANDAVRSGQSLTVCSVKGEAGAADIELVEGTARSNAAARADSWPRIVAFLDRALKP
jgi:hypothetical protein